MKTRGDFAQSQPRSGPMDGLEIYFEVYSSSRRRILPFVKGVPSSATGRDFFAPKRVDEYTFFAKNFHSTDPSAVADEPDKVLKNRSVLERGLLPLLTPMVSHHAIEQVLCPFLASRNWPQNI